MASPTAIAGDVSHKRLASPAVFARDVSQIQDVASPTATVEVVNGIQDMASHRLLRKL